MTDKNMINVLIPLFDKKTVYTLLPLWGFHRMPKEVERRLYIEKRNLSRGRLVFIDIDLTLRFN